jgi:hypothetical protein
MTTAEWIAVAGASLNAVIVPVAVYALGAMIDKRADARIAGVRDSLVHHEEHDNARFDELRDCLSDTEEHRETQHVENQKLLTKLATDFDWLKRAILRSE